VRAPAGSRDRLFNQLEADPSDPDDRVLVARTVAGDGNAFDALVRRHQNWIYNIALRMLSHPHDAQDATQDILIKALTGLASFRGHSRFRTWLYRIVVNHVLNVKRGRREPDSQHPFYESPDLVPALRQLLQSPLFQHATS